MKELPDRIRNEDELDELLSRPRSEAIESLSRLDGDIMFLGVSGKIGPSLARMAKRASEEAGIRKRIIGVGLFDSPEKQNKIESFGIETLNGDLLDEGFLGRLPEVKNIFYLAGMKFGSSGNLPLTWAINSYLPALVASRFRRSRILAFSTGCVYSLVPVESGGSVETDLPDPAGEYAQSCLGRERMFQYWSTRHGTKVILIRLNYSVEMRYGVLTDIGFRVRNRMPVDLSMGYFNVIWQGDANDFVLRSIELAESPPKILNITGPETLSVREVADEFGRYFREKPEFVNDEFETALLSNPSESFKLFGKPEVPASQVINWVAGWLKNDGRLLGKPTHFETRNGKY